MESASVASPTPEIQVDQPALKKNAITFISNIVIGVASTAPGVQPRGDTRLHRRGGGLGFHSPAVILVAFFPMAFIAAAYYYMNRADPDCGTTFAWMTKSMGPWLGWQGGWAIVVADVLVMPSLASVAGHYTFSLFGNNSPSTLEVTIVGIAWIVVMTAICYIGIELSRADPAVLLGSSSSRCPVRGRGAGEGLHRPSATVRSSRRRRGSTRSPSRAPARSSAGSCWRCSSTGGGTRA